MYALRTYFFLFFIFFFWDRANRQRVSRRAGEGIKTSTHLSRRLSPAVNGWYWFKPYVKFPNAGLSIFHTNGTNIKRSDYKIVHQSTREHTLFPWSVGVCKIFFCLALSVFLIFCYLLTCFTLLAYISQRQNKLQLHTAHWTLSRNLVITEIWSVMHKSIPAAPIPPPRALAGHLLTF